MDAAPGAPRILVAEDDDTLRSFIVDTLKARGYRVVEAANGVEAARRMWVGVRTPADFDLILSDHRMPGMTGMDLLNYLSQQENPPPVVLISAFATEAFADEARDNGVADVLAKPFTLGELLEIVRVHAGPAGVPRNEAPAAG